MPADIGAMGLHARQSVTCASFPVHALLLPRNRPDCPWEFNFDHGDRAASRTLGNAFLHQGIPCPAAGSTRRSQIGQMFMA